MELVTPQNLTLLLGFLSFLGIIFTVYNYFRNPQIKTDQTTLGLENKFIDLQRQFNELKETHLRKLEGDLTLLTGVVNKLSESVVRLSTIIDERIPKSGSKKR